MASLHGKKREARWRETFRNRAICAGVCFLAMWIFFGVAYFSISLFPETEMAFFSRCSSPFQNWDGKILDFPVWWNGFRGRPLHYNLHNERQLPHDFQLHYDQEPDDQTVVLWGTHHKTGTFLAKKLFAKVCAKQKWCCLFHVTRDSVHALRSALRSESVNALGHNQWIWHPHELNITKYKFIHFYRDPFRKVISGFRYHADGTEPWTRKPQSYAHICQNTQRLKATGPATPTGAIASVDALGAVAERNNVFDYCESVHLCETCCRRAHEDLPANGKLVAVQESQKRFRSRAAVEYDFVCEQLRGVNRSMQHTLTTLPEEQGVVVEAALEYYEILRMATLYNQTKNDPDTLNLDLDYFTENFEEGTWRILSHLKGLIPATELEGLHSALSFYNLETSPLYRWSMSNPIINHVTAHQSGGKSTKELIAVLKADPRVMALYGPIFQMMTPPAPPAFSATT